MERGLNLKLIACLFSHVLLCRCALVLSCPCSGASLVYAAHGPASVSRKSRHCAIAFSQGHKKHHCAVHQSLCCGVPCVVVCCGVVWCGVVWCCVCMCHWLLFRRKPLCRISKPLHEKHHNNCTSHPVSSWLISSPHLFFFSLLPPPPPPPPPPHYHHQRSFTRKAGWRFLRYSQSSDGEGIFKVVRACCTARIQTNHSGSL